MPTPLRSSRATPPSAVATMLPSENGRRKRYPSFREIRRSTIEEMEHLQDGLGDLLNAALSPPAGQQQTPRRGQRQRGIFNALAASSGNGLAQQQRGGGAPMIGRRNSKSTFGDHPPPDHSDDEMHNGIRSRPFFSGNSNRLEHPSQEDMLDHYDDFDHDDFEGDNYSPRTSQAYASVAMKVCVLLAIIAWLGGFAPHVPSPSSLLASPLDLFASVVPGRHHRRVTSADASNSDIIDEQDVGPRPDFVYEHPYVSSSYYTSTKSIETLMSTQEHQVMRNIRREAEERVGMDSSASSHETKTRLAIVRPFCEFDAEALPTTFTCWNALPPCKAASGDIGDEDEDSYEVGPQGELMSYKNNTAGRNLYDDVGDRHLFDLVGSDAMKNAKADVFLFYSQTFAENDVAIKAVDEIINQFFEPGGWSQCFDNIYAIEANIPQELDLYIPSAQEELYNWVNGPNRQFEAAFRIIQSGEWGDYDGFYLMEGDSVPIKAHWLDVVLSEIEVNRPFAILGAQYDGDKWDNFYEKIPISLLHHTNGNAIYNTSHPLLERLVGQLEVEAPCPYNSIPYDYRMSQMWVEGTLGIVPELAPKIMLNEEGKNITLSNNIDMFKKWADIWEKEDPFKYTPVIHNYAATNLIPRHLGPEYIIHGAKLYSPWNPTKTDVTLVVSEWFFDRSLHLVKNLDEKDHPFSEVVVMVPPAADSHEDYDSMTDVPVRTQHRDAPDFMDLCQADIKTEWFMITNSYHHVARHVDLMFTPGTFKPVIPFTPATYAFCFKYPYCKETVNLAQRINPGQDKVIQDMDMLYNTEARNAFCKEWKKENGEEGEDLYKNQQRRLMFRKKIIGPPGPTGTAYYAWLVENGKDSMYKMTDRSLYGARPPFVKIFAKEEKLDGMSEDELAKRVGMTLLNNSTDCNCGAFETEVDCSESGIGCIWRPLFESCHPPELIDGSEPICAQTEAPTMAPTLTLPDADGTESPTASPSVQGTLAEDDPWYSKMFKTREHEEFTTETNNTMDGTLEDDDDAIPDIGAATASQGRKLEADTRNPWYETNRSADERMMLNDHTVKSRAHSMKDIENMSLDDRMETLSLHDRMKEQLKLEAVLKEQELEKTRKAKVVSNLRKEEMNYKSELLRFATQTNITMVGTLEDADDTILDIGVATASQGRKLEADTRDPWYDTNRGADERMVSNSISVKSRAHSKQDIVRMKDIETLSLEEMMKAELKLEAVLKEQELEKTRKTKVVSNLRKEELYYKSKLLRLETQLEQMIERTAGLASAQAVQSEDSEVGLEF